MQSRSKGGKTKRAIKKQHRGEKPKNARSRRRTREETERTPPPSPARAPHTGAVQRAAGGGGGHHGGLRLRGGLGCAPDRRVQLRGLHPSRQRALPCGMLVEVCCVCFHHYCICVPPVADSRERYYIPIDVSFESTTFGESIISWY